MWTGKERRFTQPGGRHRAEKHTRGGISPSPKLQQSSEVTLQGGPCTSHPGRGHQFWEAPHGGGGREPTFLWLQTSPQAGLPNEGPCFVDGGCNPATQQLTHSSLGLFNSPRASSMDGRGRGGQGPQEGTPGAPPVRRGVQSAGRGRPAPHPWVPFLTAGSGDLRGPPVQKCNALALNSRSQCVTGQHSRQEGSPACCLRE